MPCYHSTSSCHVSMPHHHAISTCYVIMQHHHACHQNTLFDYHVEAWGSATWHFSQNFPCWGRTSKRNIFCIRSSFDTSFAPLESAWRALRHGTIFVEIWWFWKLSFLDPPGSPCLYHDLWMIVLRIHLPMMFVFYWVCVHDWWVKLEDHQW